MGTTLSEEDERRRKSGGKYTTGLSNWKHSKVKKKKKVTKKNPYPSMIDRLYGSS